MSKFTFFEVLGFAKFVRVVTRKSRFRFNEDTEAFLNNIREEGLKRTLSIPDGELLYRAQLGGDMKVMQVEESEMSSPTYPYNPQRMKPLLGFAKEGRVNPKGIPCLYLSDNPETAMSEVRPWIGAQVSIGEFEVMRSLKVVDCTTKLANMGDLLRATVQEHVWAELSSLFSKPISESDLTAEYAPTQILAELFARSGHDGIKYRSLLGEGGNSYALFDSDVARLRYCAVRETTSVKYSFSEPKAAYRVTSEGHQLFE